MSLQMLRLRDYQEDGSKALDLSHERGVRRPAIVLPTGAGKTIVFAHRALQYLTLADNLGKRGRPCRGGSSSRRRFLPW